MLQSKRFVKGVSKERLSVCKDYRDSMNQLIKINLFKYLRKRESKIIDISVYAYFNGLSCISIFMSENEIYSFITFLKDDIKGYLISSENCTSSVICKAISS